MIKATKKKPVIDVKALLIKLKGLSYYEPSLSERKVLSKIKEYWWVIHKGVNMLKAPAGHFTATGKCQKCKQHAEHLYTNHYGCDIYPSCHKCWCMIGLE